MQSSAFFALPPHATNPRAVRVNEAWVKVAIEGSCLQVGSCENFGGNEALSSVAHCALLQSCVQALSILNAKSW